MSRNFTITWEAPAVSLPASSLAEHDTVPTSGKPANAFDAASDESVYLEGILPFEYTGAGSLKLRVIGCANTTTAADDARIDVATEFRTPGAGEAANADNFDGTPDSGTMTFSTTAYAHMAQTITLARVNSPFAFITPAAGDKFRIRVTRDANNGASLDDLASDLLLLAYEFYEET